MYTFVFVGDEAEHEPSNEHVVIEGGHLSQLERSLITELLEYRKLEADRRKEELQVRREEIALQTRKLEQQTKQWAEEKADREARLALEKEERQLVIALLRKVLVPNGTGWFDPTARADSTQRHGLIRPNGTGWFDPTALADSTQRPGLIRPNGTGWFDCFFSKWHTYFSLLRFSRSRLENIPQYSCFSVPLFLANHFVQRSLLFHMALYYPIYSFSIFLP